MPLRYQIQRSLRNTDVRFNADNGDLIRVRRRGTEGEAQLRDHHAERSFIDCERGLVGREELGAERTETGEGLCGGVDGDGEGMAGLDHFLGGRDAGGVIQ